MTWSLSRPAVHAARDVDELLAAEWALEDLDTGGAGSLRPRAREERQEAEARAREEAERLEREAELRRQEEADARRRELEEARRQGYEEGRLAGEEAEAARLRNAVSLAERALDEIREGEMRWTGSIEENICALAVAVARQVIGRELKGDVETVVDLVRRALQEFPVDQPVRIRVNPTDLSAIEAASGSTSPGFTAVRERDVRWLADVRVTPGGCVVEGRERIVDGRVDNSLERLYRRLTYNHV